MFEMNANRIEAVGMDATAEQRSGVLYIVATPIGNLEDMTFRAVRILSEVAVIAAEDTRHSRKLLTHFGISTPLTSCFAHNEMHKREQLVERLLKGDDIALISDAGTPAICDPGSMLVQLCIKKGVRVVPIPGASAVIAGLSAAGLPTDMFTFVGFVPAKKSERVAFLQRWGALEHTLVAYEAPHRLLATLEDISTHLGSKRELVVARELTKVHEELFRGEAAQAHAYFSTGRVKGEIVLLLQAQPDSGACESVEDTLLRLLKGGDQSLRQVSKEVARIHPLSGSEAYSRALELQRELND